MLLYLYFPLGSQFLGGVGWCLRQLGLRGSPLRLLRTLRMCWGRFVCTSNRSPSHSRRGTCHILGAARGSFPGDTYLQMLRGGDRFLGSRVSGIGIAGGSVGWGCLHCCVGGAGW